MPVVSRGGRRPARQRRKALHGGGAGYGRIEEADAPEIPLAFPSKGIRLRIHSL